MKTLGSHLRFVLVFLSVISFIALAAAASPPPRLMVEMRDGSRVAGQTVEDTVSVHSAAMGKLKLGWATLRAIEYAASSDTARLTATNGDAFTVQLDDDTLRLQTDFGQTELPVKLIRSIKVAPPTKPTAARTAAGTTDLRLTIELRDGSHLVGKGLDDALNFHSPTMGDLKLTWAGIRSVVYASEKSATARLTTTNGDAYEVEFVTAAVHMETSFGKNELPVKSIRSIKVSAIGRRGQLTDGLVFFWSGTGDGKANIGTDPDTLNGLSSSGTVEVADNPNLVSMQQTRQLTIAVWIKPNSIPREFPVVVGKGGNWAPSGYGGYELYLNSYGDNDIVFVSGTCVLETGRARGRWVNNHLGEWIHVVFTLDDTTRKAKFYVNGQPTNDEIDEGSYFNGSAPLNFNVSNKLYIGAPGPAGHRSRTRFDGEMRDVKLFNRVLTAEEIQADYKAGHSD